AANSGLEPRECSVLVQFSPQTFGTRSGDLQISSNDPAGVFHVTLRGTGASPSIALSPASINFGSALAGGGLSAVRSVSARNTGTADLTVSSATVSGANSADFVVTSVLPCTAHPGGDCTLQVKFQPRGFGARTAQLLVSSNAFGHPTTI